MIPLLPLRVDGVWLAIDAGGVVEIVGARTRMTLPEGPALAPAVLAHRGRAVPALDVGLVLGGPTSLAVAALRRRTVIVAVGASTLALPVDAAREVQEVDEGALGPPPAAAATWATRAAALDEGTAPVIDLARVLYALAGDA